MCIYRSGLRPPADVEIDNQLIGQSIYARNKANLKHTAVAIMTAFSDNTACLPYKKSCSLKSTWWDHIIVDDNDEGSKGAAGLFWAK